MNKYNRLQCHFCGASISEISERTEEIVNSIFDCPKCRVNYCDQCSYSEDTDQANIQRCLRCDSKLDKLSDHI